MTRSTLPPEIAVELHARRARFWARVAICLAAGVLASQIALMVIHARDPAPPTLHTRRITAGGQTVSLEIPDGQCATVAGATVCVPPARTYVTGDDRHGRIRFAHHWDELPQCVLTVDFDELSYLCAPSLEPRKVSP